MKNSDKVFKNLVLLTKLGMWREVSLWDGPLSEEFIEKHKSCLHWNHIWEYQVLSEVFIEKVFDYIDWYSISEYQILSEAFIEKYQDKVNWNYISRFQTLSEDFIRKFKSKVVWFHISKNQTLSESFIEEHSMFVDWERISRFQYLSEAFIEKFKDKVDWDLIARTHPLSLKFRRKWLNPWQLSINMKNNSRKTLAKKRREMERYAKLWNLKFDGEFLYAFRDHDRFGRGDFNATKRYEKGKTYRDWHCDMDVSNVCSFGLGIWPEGNTPVKVAVKDWGCAVTDDEDKFKKGRVWAFTVL